MIGKVAPKRRDGKSSIRAVTRYIAGVGHDEKCTYIGTRNLHLIDFPGIERPDDFIDLAVAEMSGTALQNKRSADPVLHIIMSWPHDENPTPAQASEAVSMLAENYGLQECQCVYGMHQNTDHTHLHIAWNRIHPESYRAIQPAQNWTKKTLEKTMREVELRQGWGVELSGKHYTIQDGAVISTKDLKERENNGVALSQTARRVEAHTGDLSAQSILIERVAPILKTADSWRDFKGQLQGQGIEYQKKGSGAVFVFEGITVKASQVARNATLQQLEKRFGEYRDTEGQLQGNAPAAPEKQEKQSPYQAYDAAKKAFLEERRKVLAWLKVSHQDGRQELYGWQRTRRKEALAGSWKGRGAERNFLSSLMAIEHARERKELIGEQENERLAALERIGRFPSFKDWNGQPRKPANFVDWEKDIPEGKKVVLENGIFGLEAVRVAGGAGYRHPGEVRPLVVDVGRKIRTSDLSEEAVLATLQLAQAKWGGCRVHGSAAYIDLCLRVAVANGITITNPELQEKLEVMGHGGTNDAGGDHGLLRRDPGKRTPGRSGRNGNTDHADAGRPRAAETALEGGVDMGLSERSMDIRKQIVDDVCAALEKGTDEWQKTWKTMQNALPINPTTGRAYRGGNAFSLAFYGTRTEDPDDNRWCTLQQANEQGWKIKKGSKSEKISYYEVRENEQQNPDTQEMETNRTPIMKWYSVFHASQIEGIPPLERPVKEPFQKIEQAERILAESGAIIKHGGDKAAYRRKEDTIILPQPEAFQDPEAYYATALHELGHWTGAPSRLDREKGKTMRDDKYAREELVAEMTSMFVGGETGLIPDQTHFDNHASYINHWLSALKEDPNELFRAAAAADKASNLILQHEHKREQEQAKAQSKEHASATPEKDPLEKEVKALKLIDGDAKVYTKPSAAGIYKGEILHVDEERGYSVQKVGKVSLVVHKHEKLEHLPQRGENLRITYKGNEKAQLVAQEAKKEKVLSR